jgi:sigma-B regulation protein RsbU (phosphoserine phosphatase)
MLCRAASGRVERLPAMQTILGFVPHPGYQIESVRLHTGDVLLLYTDGVTEAMDTAGEMFGEDRLAQALANAAPRGARGVVEAVLSAVEAFRNPRLRTDDVTVVAIRAVGPWRSP